MLLLTDRRTGGAPAPAEVITVTIGGKTFRAGRRTAAHLQATFEAFTRAFPDLTLVIAQPCYHSGYAPSAGTHDGDGVPDFYVARRGSVLASTEADYWAVQRFMREQGWAIWFRHTGSWAGRGSWHLHGVSLGCPGPVGIFVPGQVDDYYRHALGLKGQHDSGDDPSWHPADIDSTVFDYPAWLIEQEDNMPYTDWSQKDRDALASDVAKAVLTQTVDADGKVTLKQAVNQVRNTVAKLLGK